MAPPTSVLLPTTTRSTVVEDIAMQLGSCDELLIICDRETDPVVDYAAEFERTRVIVAGEPVGCSGKANAIATGMEAATHDRIVWTDDDFYHPPDWLTKLHRAYDREGPVSELYFFVGRIHFPSSLNRFTPSGGHSGPMRTTRSGQGR